MKDIKVIGDLPRHLLLVNDSQDADAVRESIMGAANYDSFFVAMGEGEYTEVWGFEGYVPWNFKKVWPVIPPAGGDHE